MSEKSIVQEARDIQLVMELITLSARLQVLGSKTQSSRNRLVKLYKRLHGSPPPRGVLPFPIDWLMIWKQNVHASMLCNAWQFLLKVGLCSGVDTIIETYRLYLEQRPQSEKGPLLALIRTWALVRFIGSGLLELPQRNCCGGNFITHAHQPTGSFACSLYQPPSRAVKRRKLSQSTADIIPQPLDEQIEQTV